MENNYELARRIKSVRAELGIGQRKFAVILKISRSALSLFELGLRRLPSHAKQTFYLMEKSAGQINIEESSYLSLNGADAGKQKEQASGKIEESLAASALYEERKLLLKVLSVHESIEKKTRALERMKLKNEAAIKFLRVLSLEMEQPTYLPKNYFLIKLWYDKAFKTFLENNVICQQAQSVRISEMRLFISKNVLSILNSRMISSKECSELKKHLLGMRLI